MADTPRPTLRQWARGYFKGARQPEARSTDLADLLMQVLGTGVPGNTGLWDGGRFPIETTSGVWVTPTSAMHNPTVWRCRQLIAGTISTLPVDVYRRVAGAPQEVSPTPVLIANPSGEMTPRAWRSAAIESLMFDGNIVGQVVNRDALGRPTQVELVDLAYVTVRRDPDTAEWRWRIYGREVPASSVWHVAMDPPPGCILGRSLIQHAAEVIGTGLASMKYAAGYFGDGAHPTMVVRNTMLEINQAQASAIANRIIEVLSTARRPLVVGKGYEVDPWQANPTDTLLVDVWASNVTNVANYFGVPAELLGGKTSGSMTYTNLEARTLDLVKFCLGLWAAPLEEAWTRSIASPQYAKINWDALLRPETATRYAAHATAIRSGFKTPNEVRELEDLPPFEGGDADELLWPPYTTVDPSADEAAPDAMASTGAPDA